MNIEKFKQIINENNNIVFFGGAGVSTESGIKDFRSKDGLYSEKYEYPPEQILSHTFFNNNPSYFYKFYREKMNSLNIEPNITHKKLAKLEKMGKLKCVITQNIDGLHTKAGSKNVLEIHGSIYRNYCLKCHKFYEASKIFNSKNIPLCECGGYIKPDVVLYEEPLNETFDEAIKYISECEVLIVGGTSLMVYPAANLINYFKGKYLILINQEKTKYDNMADIVIYDKLGNVFKEV